ncbi:MAG TPA: hypothetical protein VE596_13700 [Gaiellaceae bacterium]|nr:hypothetical protein [Gaiellaceae bacterium]
MRRRLLLVLAGAAALAAPPGARAADHLYLDASTRSAAPSRAGGSPCTPARATSTPTDEAGDPSPLTRGGYVRVRLVRRGRARRRAA